MDWGGGDVFKVWSLLVPHLSVNLIGPYVQKCSCAVSQM